MERRTFLGAVGGLGTLGLAAVGTSTGFASSKTLRGAVEAKSITGRGGDGSHDVLAHEGTLVVDDEAYREDFSDWRDVTVDEELARKFESDYEDVFYNLHVDHETVNPAWDVQTGETLAYRTDRQLFNSVQVGDTVRFETADGDIPRIASLNG